MENLIFKDWYESFKGISNLIDFHERKMEIFNVDGILLSSLVLSKSIDSVFELSELFSKNAEIGNYLYFVGLNGYDNRKYLWR
ncbi:hypothetical protein [Algoriphagus sp. Y33]|uniref:hypothetical protein n=1 Tax=Algoriphagus sp. Y33 TaxID=2772483 RepID=UPI001785BFE5|nr:hypothetical protein [Algoriphagus sp. Y33]